MIKIALGLEYNGAHYYGFQRQSDAHTVQGALEAALSKVADEPISLICAGRTDRGVHACQQIIHFETNAKRQDLAWVLGVNAHLPIDIKVNWMKTVPSHFNARKSALYRRYLYVIYNNRIAPGLMQDKVSWIMKPLDDVRMQQAAKFLEGEHDFSAFRASGCQAISPVRKVHYVKIHRKGRYIFIEIKANAFLQNMVRNIVGSLLPVGRGEAAISSIQTILASKDRTEAGITAKPNGLYFLDVGYDPEYGLPSNVDHFWSEIAERAN